MLKIAEFCDIEVYMNKDFEGKPSILVVYLDDDVKGMIDLQTGEIDGGFSKYVLPVIRDWFGEYRDTLLNMWGNRKIEVLPAWGE